MKIRQVEAEFFHADLRTDRLDEAYIRSSHFSNDIASGDIQPVNRLFTFSFGNSTVDEWEIFNIRLSKFIAAHSRTSYRRGYKNKIVAGGWGAGFIHPKCEEIAAQAVTSLFSRMRGGCQPVHYSTVLVPQSPSQWPRGLLYGSEAAGLLLGLRVPIPPSAWMSVVNVVCVLM